VLGPFGILAVALFALLAGGVVGWLVWGRLATELSDIRAKREQAEAELASGRALLAATEERARQAELLRPMLSEVTAERDAALRDLAAVKAAMVERDAAHQVQLAQLTAAREELSAKFSEVGGQLLETAQRQFLERADARFRQSEEKSGQELKALLAPVNERLYKYEQQVSAIEQSRQEAYGNLTGLIEAMRSGQEAVRGEAARLVNALRAAPKARGRWGEQQLRNVLESCGLSHHADFMTEVSVTAEDGRLRPDVVIRIPGGRTLVVDAKVSLNAYQDAYDAIDEGARAAGLVAHATAIRAHVQGLAAREYQKQFGDGLDYVVMFVPGEHFLTAALEQDGALWDYAFERRVLLATPTNLIAIARTIAAVWRQEDLAREAKEIGKLGKEMHERLAKVVDELRKVGGGLTTAVRSYNQFVASFDSRLMPTARKFAALNIDTGGKDLPDELDTVELLPRYDDNEADQGTADLIEAAAAE
jgi:DNA recombination protein RmuC